MKNQRTIPVDEKGNESHDLFLDLIGSDLFQACREGKYLKLEALLACDFVDPSFRDSDGNTCLHFACFSNKPLLVELILRDSKKNLLNEKTYSLGLGPIQLACFNGNNDIVALLHTKYNVDIKQKSIQGLNMLHIAAKSRNGPFNDPCKTLEYLVSKGLNVNEQDPILKQTPLHVAVQYHRDLEVVKTLVKLGVDCNAQDFLGRTAAHIAKDLGSELIYNFLKSKTDLFKTDIRGISAHPDSKTVQSLKTFCIYDIGEDKRLDLDPFHRLDNIYNGKQVTLSKYHFETTEEALQTFHELSKTNDISLQFRTEVTEGPLARILGYAFINGAIVIMYPVSNSLDEIKLKDEESRIGVCLQLVRILERTTRIGFIVRNVAPHYLRLIKNAKSAHEFNLIDAGLSIAYKRDPELKKVLPKEILEEGKDFNLSSDQYSLGITIFEIFMMKPFNPKVKLVGPQSLKYFVDAFQGCTQDDRMTLKEIHDGLVEFNREVVFDLMKSGKYVHQCACPKKHPEEEIVAHHTVKAMKVIDYHEKDMKQYVSDDRKTVFESEPNVFMNTKWKDFLEKHLAGGYKESTGESLTNDEIQILENMKTFIFDDTKNTSLFTIKSVQLLEKLVIKMTKNWHTSIDLLQRLVIINHSLQLLIHSKNSIFDKIFSLKWLDLSKPAKILILKLFTHLVGKEEEALNFCQTKLDKIITFAILGLKEEDKGIQTQTINLITNLSFMSCYLKANWENLLNAFSVPLQSENRLLLLPLHRFLRSSELLKLRSKKYEEILSKWDSSSFLLESIITMYQLLE